MLVLYKHKVVNKKGILVKYIKQIYSIDIYGDIVKIGGNGDTGFNMYFWPEGNLSNLVISKQIADSVNIGHEIETDSALIYKIH